MTITNEKTTMKALNTVQAKTTTGNIDITYIKSILEGYKDMPKGTVVMSNGKWFGNDYRSTHNSTWFKAIKSAGNKWRIERVGRWYSRKNDWVNIEYPTRSFARFYWNSIEL